MKTLVKSFIGHYYTALLIKQQTPIRHVKGYPRYINKTNFRRKFALSYQNNTRNELRMALEITAKAALCGDHVKTAKLRNVI